MSKKFAGVFASLLMAPMVFLISAPAHAAPCSGPSCNGRDASDGCLAVDRSQSQTTVRNETLSLLYVGACDAEFASFFASGVRHVDIWTETQEGYHHEETVRHYDSDGDYQYFDSGLYQSSAYERACANILWWDGVSQLVCTGLA